MPVACLVLGHGGAAVLARSLAILKEAEVSVFIHLDPKVNRIEYVCALGELARECVFVEKPVAVHWGGYSMVQAELLLLETARDAGPFDKYLLISDDSFPLVPPNQLREALQAKPDLITVARLNEASPIFSRYSDFYCLDHETTSVRGSQRTGKVDEELERKIIEISNLRRIGKKQGPIYWGSQFWALTQKSVDLVLHVVKEDVHLRRSFEYSALPDETMIHSILSNELGQHGNTSGPVYADFSGQLGPRIISTGREIPLDLKPTHLFLRKIAPSATDLLNQMTRSLLLGQRINGPDSLATPSRKLGGMSECQEVETIRLCAPTTNSGPEWQGLECYNGRYFRWTARERVEWSFDGLSLPRGSTRFVITPVIAAPPDFVSVCTLTFVGQTRHLELRDGAFEAIFEHELVTSVTVLLATPKLTSPREANGFPDDRKLGLSIAT